MVDTSNELAWALYLWTRLISLYSMQMRRQGLPFALCGCLSKTVSDTEMDAEESGLTEFLVRVSKRKGWVKGQLFGCLILLWREGVESRVTPTHKRERQSERSAY